MARLICSDSMARGMDVENAQCVISYEPPPYLKTYIHRIGRTARAGKTGTAFTLLEAKEVRLKDCFTDQLFIQILKHVDPFTVGPV